MPAPDLDALFGRTLEGDYDADAPWEAVHALRSLDTREVFEKAVTWCSSDVALRRARGADVLGQLGKTAENPTTSFREESVQILRGLLENETEPVVLGSTIAALGHLGVPSVVPTLCRYVSHPDAAVRFDLAFALGCYPNDVQSAAAMLQLTADADSDVRDWATFGLGALGDLDSDEIRTALFRNSNDPDSAVREEAIVGLCKRGDLRARPALLSALREPDPSNCTIDSATYLLSQEWDSQRQPAEYLADLEAKFPEHIK